MLCFFKPNTINVKAKISGETHPALFPTDEFANFEIWDSSDFAGHIKLEGAIKTKYWRQALENGLSLEK